MRANAVAARRARTRQLAEAEARARCHACKRALGAGVVLFLGASGREVRYCSDECKSSDDERRFSGRAR